MSLKSKIKRAAERGSFVGTIVSYSNGLASIALSGKGSVITNVPVIGNTSIGASVTVSYISGDPIAYASGTVEPSRQPEIRTLALQESDYNNTIAGWTIEENSLYSSNGNVFLDSLTPAVRVGSATDYLTGTGFWVGLNSTLYKMHVGNPSGQYISWDGSALLVAGSAQSTDFSTGVSGWQIQADGDAEFNNVKIRGAIESAVFTQSYIQAMRGSIIVSKSAGTLSSTATKGTSTQFTFTVEGTAFPFAQLDILRFKSATYDMWCTVSTWSGSGTYTCTATYASGNTAATWYEGQAIVDYGQSGDGFLFMTADDTNGPFYSVVSHAGAPWTTQTLRAKLGNLNGSYGITTEQYGVGIGDYASNNYLMYDPASGFKIKAGAGAIVIDSQAFRVVDPGTAIQFENSGTVIGRIRTTRTYNGTNYDTSLFLETGTIGTELLSNTSFPTNTSGWTETETGDAVQTITWVSTTYRTSSGSVEFYIQFEAGSIVGGFLTFASAFANATAGNIYQFSAHIKVTDGNELAGGSASMYIDWYNSSDVLISSSTTSINIEAVTGWVYYQVTGTAPATTAKMKARIYADHDITPFGTMVFYVDDCSLHQVTSFSSLQMQSVGTTNKTYLPGDVYAEDDLLVTGGIHVGAASLIPIDGDVWADNDIRADGGIVSGDTSIDPAVGDIMATADGRIGGGLYVGGTGTNPATGEILSTSHIRTDGGIVVGSTSLTPTDNSVLYTGNLISYKNSTNYTGYAYVPLTSPLTSTSFDGDAFSSVSRTLVDLSTVFSAPAGIKAIAGYLRIADSGSTTTDCWISLGPTNTSTAGVVFSVPRSGNNHAGRFSYITPCDANGDVYYEIAASGASTFTLTWKIDGYWI